MEVSKGRESLAGKKGSVGIVIIKKNMFCMNIEQKLYQLLHISDEGNRLAKTVKSFHMV